MDMYTLRYLKWMTDKDLPYSTWNSAQCYVAAWMGIDTRICIAESLCCSPETITTLFISSTSIQNKKLEKNNKKEVILHFERGSTFIS